MWPKNLKRFCILTRLKFGKQRPSMVVLESSRPSWRPGGGGCSTAPTLDFSHRRPSPVLMPAPAGPAPLTTAAIRRGRHDRSNYRRLIGAVRSWPRISNHNELNAPKWWSCRPPLTSYQASRDTNDSLEIGPSSWATPCLHFQNFFVKYE